MKTFAIGVYLLFSCLSFSAEDLSTWFKGIKVEGDFRLRGEFVSYENDQKNNRNRGRFRLRFGLEKQLSPLYRFGLRLASGGGDATSTNQTFTDGFEGKDIWIDRAYLTYEKPWIRISAGKVANPFEHTDIVWDSDVNPEGLYERLRYKNIFFTAAKFYIKENKSSHNADVTALQFVYKQRKWMIALAYYDFKDIEDSGFSSNGNNGYAEDFNMLDLMGYYKWKISGTPIMFKMSYTKNLGEDAGVDIEERNIAYGIYFKIGSAKKTGQWEGQIKYARIESNAVVGALSDSDFGAADKKGFVGYLKYRQNKFLSWKLIITDVEGIDLQDVGFSKAQFDLGIKF